MQNFIQGFVDQKYYVDCRTHDEIVHFFKMCENANLFLRSGYHPSHRMAAIYRDNAVFAYDWRGKGDGISSWSGTPGQSDFNKPHKLFSDFLNEQEDQQCINNMSDILNLL